MQLLILNNKILFKPKPSIYKNINPDCHVNSFQAGGSIGGRNVATKEKKNPTR